MMSITLEMISKGSGITVDGLKELEFNAGYEFGKQLQTELEITYGKKMNYVITNQRGYWMQVVGIIRPMLYHIVQEHRNKPFTNKTESIVRLALKSNKEAIKTHFKPRQKIIS